MSSNFIKLFKILGFDDIQSVNDLKLEQKNILLDNVVLEFDIKNYVNERMLRLQSKRTVEEIYTLDLYSFKDFCSQNVDFFGMLENFG